ncbi:MAG: hypothetical protein K2O73_09190, partial [Lachnospiraceae bacterium]|nr:hypothetical protein [Lachnospiraceae bacterium]
MYIYVEEYGKKFVLECLKRYFGDSKFLVGLFVLYAVSVIFLLVKGSRKERTIFVYPTVVWLLTVFNPWVSTRFITMFRVDIRYYRYFWMLPIAVLLVYMLVKILEKCNKAGKAGVLAGCGLVCVLCHSQILPMSELPVNAYRMNEEVRHAADIVAADKNKESVKAVFDGIFFYEIRQYDPSIQSFFSEIEMKELVDMQITQEDVDEAVAADDYHALVKYIYCFEPDVDM